jgi:hypothetical protein
MVPTPVGMRCARCADVRRLPQFDVGAVLLVRSAVSGLAVSLVLWYVASFVPFLRFFLAIAVGAAVGEVMSRMARRRVSRMLDAGAAVVVIAGLLIVQAMRMPGGIGDIAGMLGQTRQPLIYLAIPAVVASFVAVKKLR